MRLVRGRLRLQAARVRRAVPVLQPARGRRPRAVAQDRPSRRAALPDRRSGGAPAGRRLAEGPVVRAFGHLRAGARAGPAAWRLPALLDLRQPHPHRPTSGRRGDVYYETQYVETMVNGRRQRQAVQVPKVRWRPASGTVARDVRRRAGAGRRDPANPPGRGAGALGPRGHAPLHRRLSDRLRRRTLPDPGRPRLRARRRRSCTR